MGKKRSRSKDEDYDKIFKKLKKLEHKLQKKRKRISISESSESENYNTNNLPDENITLSDEVFDEGTGLNNECSFTPLEPLGPPEQPEPTTLIETSAPAPGALAVSAEAAQITPHDDTLELASLDPEILLLLGEDPTSEKTYGENLHKDIAPRWAFTLTNGMSKDTQVELAKRYLLPENCKYMAAPKLNPEIKAALSEMNTKKDLYSQCKQQQLGSSLAAIGRVLNWALKSNNSVPQDVIKSLSDAGRLICDSHYRESLSRRYAALNTLNRNIKDTIKNTKIDEYLFGTDLSEHIKSSKAISKTGSEIKPLVPRPVYKAPATIQPQRGTLNSRGMPRAPAAEPRTNPAPRRPPRDRRLQEATRGRRPTAYSRHQTKRR